jgi:hypothetical protein
MVLIILIHLCKYQLNVKLFIRQIQFPRYSTVSTYSHVYACTSLSFIFQHVTNKKEYICIYIYIFDNYKKI